MQHSRRPLHHTEYDHRQRKPQIESNDGHDHAHHPGLPKGVHQRHFPQNLRELLVRQGERPQPQVGRRVGDAIETELYRVYGQRNDVTNREQARRWESQGGGGGGRTDGMNGLVNHYFRKLKFLVFLFADILGDHGGGFVVGSHTVTTTVEKLPVLVIRVKRIDSRVFSDPTIPFSADLVIFVPQVQWLQQEKNGDTDSCTEYKRDLNELLARIELFFDIAWLEEHIDEHIQQARSGRSLTLAVVVAPVNGPFEDDGENEIAEDGLEKDHAGDKIGPNIDG